MHSGAVTTRRPPLALWELLALLAIIGLGTAARLDDLGTWRHDVASHFAAGEPLLRNPDGYHYLSLARDLVEDRYAPVDPLRGAPSGVPRPHPPPPLSLLTAATATVTGVAPGWVAALLPAVLGPLLALPVFAVGRRLGGRGCGLASALIAVLSHYHVYRTAVGFHDTDALNVTLATALAWCGLALMTARPQHFAAWLAACCAAVAAWLWWWPDAWSVVILCGSWTLAGALALRPRRHHGEGRVVLVAAAAALVAMLALVGVDAPLQLAAHLRALVEHVTKAGGGAFPNVAESIGELAPAGVPETARMTLGDPLLLAFSVAGLAVMLMRNPRAGVILLPLAGLAVAGVVHAQRFLIFAAPVTGLGIGFFVAAGLDAARGRRSIAALVGVGALAATAPSAHRAFSIDFTPSLDADLVSSMQWLADNAPADAVVWSAWDHGYPLRYWSRRATVNDGSVHDGEATVYSALPFAAPDATLATHFMRFYSVHGRAGMHRIFDSAGGVGPGLALARRVFAAGPRRARAILAEPRHGIAGDGERDAWLAFLFPADPPAIYLLMDERMLRTSRWWYRFGTWNGAPPDTPPVRMQAFAGLAQRAGRITGPRVDVDSRRGVARLEDGGAVPLSRLVIATGRRIRERGFPRAGPEFHLNAVDGVGVLQDPALAGTLFNRAFVLRAADPRRLRQVHGLGARVQVWRVVDPGR